MAQVTLLGTATFNTTAGNKTVTTTPAVGDLIVIIAATSGLSGGTTSVTDNNSSGTYTQVDSDRTGFSTTGVLTVWVRDSLISSATSTVFTANQSGSTGGGLVVLKVTGMTKTGASAVRSNGGQSSGTAATTPAPVLSNTPQAGNPVITAVACGTNSTTFITARTSYTERFENGYATPTTGLHVSTRDTGETSATLTYGSTVATAFASVGIELDTSLNVNTSDSITVKDSTTSTATYYFDGSDAAASDPNSVWSNDANAFDSDLGTGASSTTAGSVSTNYLMAEGTNAPSSGDSISQVRARIYINSFDTNNAAIYTDGLGELLGTATAANLSGDWGSYTTLSTPSGGWTWAKVQALEVKIYGSGTPSLGYGVYQVGIEVTTAVATDYITVSIGSGVSTPTVNKSDSITVTESTSIKRSTNALIDNFNDNTLDTVQWNEYETGTATAAETGGTMVVTPPNTTAGSNYAGYYSDVAYNLTDSYAFVEVPTVTSGATNAQTYFELEIDSNNLLGFKKEGANLVFQYVSSGTPNTTSTTYNSTDHRWWRIRHSGANVLWDTSPDGLTWTNQRTVATPITITTLYAEIGAGTYQSESSPGTAVFDNFNFELNRTVSVSDTTTITESVGRLLESNVNKSDTVTITENTQRLLESRVSTSDTATITENTGRLLESYVNKSDTATITENTTQLLESYVNKSDTATITENVSATVETPAVSDRDVNVSDSITVSENAVVDVQPTTTPTISVSDTITLTESINRLLESYVNKSDTVTVTENIARLLESYVNKSDSITITENIARLLESRVNVNDTATITENVSRLLESYINKSDNVTITESVGVYEPFYNLSVSDNITVTDSPSVAIEVPFAVNTNDTATVSENISLLITELHLSVQDSTSISESIGRLVTSSVATSDTVSITESTRTELNSHVTTSDTATITENTSVAIQPTTTPEISVSDSITVSESISTLIPFLNVNKSDNITVSELRSVSVEGVVNPRKYYIDTNGEIYWVISQSAGIVERI